jgi:hypothetical protein
MFPILSACLLTLRVFRSLNWSAFGALDITLPSKQEDSKVVVEYGWLKKLFEVSKSSEYDCSYLSWFSTLTLSFVAVP